MRTKNHLKVVKIHSAAKKQGITILLTTDWEQIIEQKLTSNFENIKDHRRRKIN